VKQQVGLQLFIVKMLIIRNTDNHPIYIKMDRRGKEASYQRDRERERDCEKRRVAENRGSISCKNGLRNRPFRDNLGSRQKDYLIARNYFNGEG
jgi:hypothetical protein